MDGLIVYIIGGLVFAEGIGYLNRVGKRPQRLGAFGYLAQVVGWPVFLVIFLRGLSK